MAKKSPPSGNTDSGSPVVVVSKATHFFSQKTIRIVVILAVVLIGAGAILIILINNTNNQKSASLACSNTGSPIDQEAGVDLSKDNLVAMATITKTIQKLPGYQQDPNCMFIITAYYVLDLKPTQAQASLKLFDKVYTSKTRISKYLLDYQSVSQLNKEVDVLVVNSQHGAVLFQPGTIKATSK